MNTTVSEASGRKRPGRPREFDAEAVLDKAIAMFSSRGFSATSISDLTDALGLTSGSIYKAYGDKKGIFCAALERYVRRRDGQLAVLLGRARTGRERVEATLASYVDNSHGDVGRTGCLVVASAIEFASTDPELGRQVAALLSAREARLLRFIEEGQADGSIGPHVNAAATARLLMCVTQGMRVLGKTGRKRTEMAEVVKTAMRLLD